MTDAADLSPVLSSIGARYDHTAIAGPSMAPLVAFFLLANMLTTPARLYDLAKIDQIGRAQHRHRIGGFQVAGPLQQQHRPARCQARGSRLGARLGAQSRWLGGRLVGRLPRARLCTRLGPWLRPWLATWLRTGLGTGHRHGFSRALLSCRMGL